MRTFLASPALRPVRLAEAYASGGPMETALPPPPMPQVGHADFCVADGNFVIAGAQSCHARSTQRLVRFSAIKPSETEQGLTAYLGEEADYEPPQARLAGVQRLLVIAGYDANPI